MRAGSSVSTRSSYSAIEGLISAGVEVVPTFRTPHATLAHTLAPLALAGPMHRHTREDEYSFVIEGRLGAIFGDEEVVAGPWDFVFKPRGEWHTFWNPGTTTTRVLELITPSGLEDLFRTLGQPGVEMDPEGLPALAAQYGCEVDFERTMQIIEKHGLSF